MPSLGSYAGVIREIERLIGLPASTLPQIAEVIETDPDLAARLLRLGNSSFFGFPNRLETVSEAITLIGIQQVQDLILASSVVEMFQGIPEDLVCMESFWKHSLACGIVSRCLAVACQMPEAEKFFIVGLLHDLGRLVLLSRAPQKAAEVFARYQESRILLRDAEVEVLGFDHAQIAEELMRLWQYPATLIQAVAFHHHPISARVYQLETAIVHVADYLVHAMGTGSSGERFVPPLNHKAWDRIGLSPNILESVMNSVDEQIHVLMETFFHGRGSLVGQVA
jgi:HD-like signal output (HDOD) protein